MNHHTPIYWISTPRGLSHNLMNCFKEIPKNYHSGSKTTLTIQYKDGSSYTLKNVSSVESLAGKHHRNIRILHERKPEVIQRNNEVLVEEYNPVDIRVTLKAADVKALVIKTDSGYATVTKFD